MQGTRECHNGTVKRGIWKEGKEKEVKRGKGWC